MNEAIVSTSFARAGLLGNPSDGYNGKAISLTVRDFSAVVELRPSEFIEIHPETDEMDTGNISIHEFVARLDHYGFYGATRLIKATIKRFYDYCDRLFPLHDQNFSIKYRTNIPRSVGLAGSSAIITAALKSLTRFYDVEISKDVLASLALSTEKDLLGISAGLMDRVIQMLEGVVFMDFSAETMHDEGGVVVGRYEHLPPGAYESGLYVAWAARAAEPTEVLHNRLQERFARGDQDVVRAMHQFAEFAERGKQAIQENDVAELSWLIDSNFNLRSSICQLPQLHRKMVELARVAGGSAKFCGSGGAIIGMTPDQTSFEAVVESLESIGCHVIRPTIRPSE